MTMNAIFSAGNLLVLPGWLMLVLLPGWRGTQWVAGLAIPVLISIAYAGLILTGLSTSDGGGEGNFNSIVGVRALMQSDSGLTAAWFHYLAFDLFIGAWEVREGRRIGVSQWLMLPVLLFTFMLGPVGLVLFLIVRAVKQKRVQAPV
ncbi:MAG: ABA4-like family protein [Pacificimonas sp.]